MKKWLVCLVAGLLVFTVQAQADITGLEEEEDGIAGVNLQPVRGGRWEITPIFSMRFNGNDFFYRAGVAVAYSINRFHQVGGSFVGGNREYDRLARRDFAGVEGLDSGTIDARGRYFTIDEGFGSSASAFYRLNLPFKLERRTYPFVEVFGARDFWGWGDVSEVGGGVGVRKLVSKRTAFTTTYGYSVLFADGETVKRHMITAGVSMFFR